MISGNTRVFAILGDPVSHSLSPAMHNAAFRVLGIDAVYVPLHVHAGAVGAAMRTLAGQGGGGNVTVPHKVEAAASCDQRAVRAERLGVVNTFWANGAGIAGDTTDVDGVLDALKALAPPPGPWLVLGTGGSARAVAAAAAECGVALAVRSRAHDRAADFSRWAATLGVPEAAPADAVVVVNATPIGLRAEDGLPIPVSECPSAAVALDLVYARGETPWVHAMRAAGRRAADGRAMLVAQGAAAFRRWFPRSPAPVEVMKAAVRDALG